MTVKVAKVLDRYTLVLNAGSNGGVTIGQRFLIYEIGDEVTDPDSGASLGAIEIVKGTGKVTHIQPMICTIASDMKAKAGRVVRKTRKSPYGPLASVFVATEEAEEVLPAEEIAFEDPQVGDLAKLI